MSGITKSAAEERFRSGPPPHLSTLVDVVRWRANEQGDLPAFTFLTDGEQDVASLSYAELASRASALARILADEGATGEPVLLVFEPGIDYVVSFFGCLFAGAMAVPVYPPDPFNLPRTLPRLQAIVENAGARWLLTNRHLAEQTRLEQSGAKLLLMEEIPTTTGSADGLKLDATSLGATCALLQYTSGSTGTPRGVIVRHENLMHNFRAMHQMFDVPSAVVAHWLPPYHDMGLIGCLLLPIYSGRHTVAMSPMAFMQKPVRWLQAISRYRATTSGAPNFGYELCVRKISPSQCEGLDLSSWQVAVTGAEPVRAATLEAFTEKFRPFGFAGETFLPAYGMAEATLIVSGESRERKPRTMAFDLASLESGRAVPGSTPTAAKRLVGCGKAGQDVRIRIVDPESRLPVADNEIGEIWLQSPGVGAGYWRDAERTALLFQARVANEGDERYLRTGDMGFLRDDELFITGRRKELIILAGRNLYPLDLETAVQASHSDLKVDGGAAFSIEVDGEERLVVVQEVLRPKRNDLGQLLRGACEALVREAGVTPHAMLLISAGSLPKTSSGKTRRGEARRQHLEGGLRVLAQWPLPEEQAARDATPPATEMERGAAPIWEEVLGTERIGLEDDFFLLGAKSLQIAAMLGRVSDWLEIDVPLGMLFENSTLHAFSAALERLVADESEPVERQDIPWARLSGLKSAPLTEAQQRFWILHHAGIDPSALHICLRLTLRGDLKTAALRHRIKEIVRRHDMLRARFVAPSLDEPAACQQIEDEAEMPWTEVDLRNETPQDRETWLQEFENAPMDLSAAPLARAAIVRVADDQWQLAWVLHHLIADGWSTGLLLKELGDGDLSPPRAPSFASYANWLRDGEQNDRASRNAALESYWVDRLAGAPDLLEIRSGDAGDAGANQCHAELDETLAVAVHQLAKRHSATPFMVHLAAMQTVLAAYVQAEETVIGAVAANRKRPAIEEIVGCFINTVPLRCNMSGVATFSELLQRVRSNAVADLDHSDYPFESLVEQLRPRREPGRLPLVQAMLLMHDMHHVPQRIGDAALENVAARQAGLAEFDLALVVEPAVSGTRLRLHSRNSMLAPEIAERLLEAYVAVLETVVRRPQTPLGELPTPPKSERWELLVDRNATDRRLVETCPMAMLQRQADETPQRVALQWSGSCESDGTWTYQQLHEEANRIAHWLQRKGVGPDSLVALRLHRGREMLVAMLAVLKAGGAYVPLDPAHPEARVNAVLTDAQPRLLLHSSNLPCNATPVADRAITWEQAHGAARELPTTCPVQNASGDHLAYVIYTSGTTGEPKGVMVHRRAVANFLQSFVRRPGLTAGDRVLAHTTISFDISVFELLAPLCVGAQVVLASCDASRDPKRLRDLIQQAGVTFIQATPSGFRMLRAIGWVPPATLRLMSGGEPLTVDDAQFLISEGADLWNVYGPTETTVWSTIMQMDDNELTQCRQQRRSPAIGRPVDNTQAYVLDARRRPVPTGVYGELYLGGDGVARGYLHRDDLTTERFVADEFSDAMGKMMYRTGDRARWRADGNLEFAGRDDAQVKVRGFRIELGEIEHVLMTHSEVVEAAVAHVDDREGGTLAAFLVVESDAADAADDSTLREHLAAQLPYYMIPNQFVRLPNLPRTAAGKVDRQSLSQLRQADHSAAANGKETDASAAASSPLEQAVAEEWQSLLGLQEIGIHDSFFDRGGQSLKAVTMLSRLEARYGVSLDIRAFFEAPTIASTARQLLLAMATANPDLERMLAEIEGTSD